MSNAMCCDAQTKCRWWRSAGGPISSGALLVLLPKCPMCIAAYLALWMGAGTAMSLVIHLRPLLEIVFAISVILLLIRWLHFRSRKYVAGWPLP
ncbi:MAG TPA: hypothetical protein VFA02_11375 [Pseudacidobacterium sp.]|nr:hypothetical protein [Pseudacidobacterium sp.]